MGKAGPCKKLHCIEVGLNCKAKFEDIYGDKETELDILLDNHSLTSLAIQKWRIKNNKSDGYCWRVQSQTSLDIFFKYLFNNKRTLGEFFKNPYPVLNTNKENFDKAELML